ncbi:MAG: hypothetical protein JSS99_02835 [Actinobacteria bacterium]|nr:hypothetical protein [Actinomycetota bacterium]
MTLPRLSLLLALLGAALAVAGVLVGPAHFTGIEGAYFTRAAGEPPFDSALRTWGAGLALLSPRDGNLWLGAGVALLLAAAGALFAHAAGLRLVRARD